MGESADEAWAFQPVAGGRRHERVVEQVVFAIRSGVFGVGDRLPSLERMACDLRVSKPTVGEAVRLLADNGIVRARRGVNGGVTVLDDQIPPRLMRLTRCHTQVDLVALVDARRAVETQLARLAARRADAAALGELEDAVERVEAGGDLGPCELLQLDHVFHYAMARAARSELLAGYQHDILEGVAVAVHDHLASVDRGRGRLVADIHRRTFEAIRGGDLDAVDAVMDEHLGHLERVAAELEAGARARAA
jgi:GntR family transcriptional regulator, transcriptional repressor for pyruvate dehydrogenase complex